MMNKIKLATAIIFTFAISSFKPANELKWLEFNEGYALAQKTGKIMLVDVYTDWCGWCKRMDRDTYAKEEIIQAINKDFVPIKFNPEITNVQYTYKGKKLDGYGLMAELANNQIRGYPATVFVQTEDSKMELVSGYFDATRFKPVLERIALSHAHSKKSNNKK